MEPGSCFCCCCYLLFVVILLVWFGCGTGDQTVVFVHALHPQPKNVFLTSLYRDLKLLARAHCKLPLPCQYRWF